MEDTSIKLPPGAFFYTNCIQEKAPTTSPTFKRLPHSLDPRDRAALKGRAAAAVAVQVLG
jgi:hypothetical protein